MSEKKRKADAEHDERSPKKQQTIANVKVIHHIGPEIAKPVFANSPGFAFSSNLKFKAYNKKPRTGPSDLLLHSSDHPTIDYTATETRLSNSTDKYLKHYVGVYDPNTGDLQITEAKKMTVRSCIRQHDSNSTDDAGQSENQPISNYSSRAALTQEFGTKKSKRIIQSVAENRLITSTAKDSDNPLTKAIMSTLSENDDDQDDEDEDNSNTTAKESSRINKPLPVVDLSAENVFDLYPLTSLVFPHPPNQTLSTMPWKPWSERISQGKEIKTTSRFVANRVGYLTQYYLDFSKNSSSSPDNNNSNSYQTNLEILRYIQLLIELSRIISRLNHRLPLPHITKLVTKNSITDFQPDGPKGTINQYFLKEIISQFFPENIPTTYAVTLLNSTILALTLKIPPPSMKFGLNILITEPTDISLDLSLERLECQKLYKELGCLIETANIGELNLWGLDKMMMMKKKKNDDETKSIGEREVKPKFAKLKIPPTFPRIYSGRPMARRGGRR